MDSMHQDWQVSAFIGLALLFLARTSKRAKTASNYDGFGVWLRPPAWARKLFTGCRNRIRLDILSMEVAGLVCCGFGVVGWVGQPPVKSILFVVVALSIVGSVFLMGIVIAVVAIGRRGRE
jgi:hypothetical protein